MFPAGRVVRVVAAGEAGALLPPHAERARVASREMVTRQIGNLFTRTSLFALANVKV
jgi:hypothetical protein